MKLLVVSYWFPYPPVNGSKIRLYNLLKRLAEQHELHLLTFSQEEQDYEYLNQVREFCKDVQVVNEKKFTPSLKTAVSGIFSVRPRSSVECYSEEMASRVKQSLAENNFDAALAFTLRAAEYIADIAGLPKVLDEENAEAAYIRRHTESQAEMLSKFRHKMTWVKARMHERRLALKFDAVTVVSNDDRTEVESVVPELARTGKVVVVQNSVDLDLLNFSVSAKDPFKIVYTGALSYHANLDAVRHFCFNILPIVRKHIPQARFVVTGSTKNADISEFDGVEGLEFTGFVPDIKPVVAEAAVLVVPARLGGGTRLKVLEAMALGTPIVATTFGAMGINAVSGKHLMLADEPEDFARVLVDVIQDNRLAGVLTENARELVRTHFSWDTAAERLNDTILKAVRAKGESACAGAAVS